MLMRYIMGGSPIERFWKFLNPQGHDARLSDCILEQLEPLIHDNPNKLVAQSCDSRSIMSSILFKNEYRTNISTQILYITMHIKSIYSCLKQGQSTGKLGFFFKYDWNCAFYSNSSRRTEIRDAIVQRLQRGSQSR